MATVARTRYPATAISALIEARELHAHYGESHVLRGVSLSINSGESLGLLGAVDEVAARKELRELEAALDALEELQSWVEGELSAA